VVNITYFSVFFLAFYQEKERKRKNKTNYSLYYLLKKERKMRGNLYPIIVDTNERAVRGIDGTVIKSWLFQIICFTLF
jgi:hypothetical protein